MQKNCERNEEKHLESSSSTSVDSDTSGEISSSELDLLHPRQSPLLCRKFSKRAVGNSRSSEAIHLGVDTILDPGKVCSPRKSASSIDLLPGRKSLQRRRSKSCKGSVASRSCLTRKHSQKQVTLEETELSCGDVVLIRRKAQYFDDDSGQASSVFTEEEYKQIGALSNQGNVLLAHSDSIPENKEVLEKSSWCHRQEIGGGEGSLLLLSGRKPQHKIKKYISDSSIKSDTSGSSEENSSVIDKTEAPPKLASKLSKRSESAYRCEKSLNGMQTGPKHQAANSSHQTHLDSEEWYPSTVSAGHHHREQSPRGRQDQCGDQTEQSHQSQRCTMNPVAGDAYAFPSSSEMHDHKKKKAFPHPGSEESSNLRSICNQADSMSYPSKGNHGGKEVAAMGSPAALHGAFPFQYTPSGNLKIIPNQVVYETQKMSVLVDNPKNAKVNVTKENGLKPTAAPEMKKIMKRGPKKEVNFSLSVEQQSVVANDSSHHLKLYPIAKRGDIGDGVGGDGLRTTESDCMTKTSDEEIEPGLSRLLSLGENEIDWGKVSLPAKSHMLKLLEERVKNFVNPDMVVCVENNQFSCHHLVLQCYSSFFDRECDKVVELPSNKVTTRAFSLIYDWMIYSGQDSYCLLRRDNILEIFMAAQYLGIRELEEQCWAFIDSPVIFSEATAFILYMEARKKNNKEVAQLMIPRITTFFLHLVASHDFLMLSLEDVCTLLSSNYIQIHCEMQVFMSAVRWLMHDWSARACYVVEVMSCVRFGWILPWQLVDIRRNPANPEFLQVSTHPEVMQMMEDGVAFAIVWYWYGKSNEQECFTWVRALDLKVPQQRNWDPKKQEYSSYQEFVDELDAIRKAMEKKRRQMKRMRRSNPVGHNNVQNSASPNNCTSVSNAVSFANSKNVSSAGIHKSWGRDDGLQRVVESHRNVMVEANEQSVKECRSVSPRNEVTNSYSKICNDCDGESAHKFIKANMHNFPSHLVPPPEWLKPPENVVKNLGSIARK